MLRVALTSIFLVLTLCHGFHIEPRVINGDLSTKQYPFYVHLRGSFKCGGTLLSDSWIVTAAHCLTPQKKVVAFFGIDESGEYRALIEIPSANQYIYYKYDNQTYTNDIALLELPTPVTFTKYIRPVVPASVYDTLHMGSRTVTAIGTGRTKSDQSPTDKLMREAQFHTMPSEQCVAFITRPQVDPYTVICAEANYTNGQSIHMGDSGGPLLIASNNNLIGLPSLYRCFMDSELVELQVFTNIPFYYEWIEAMTGLTMPKRYGRQAFD